METQTISDFSPFLMWLHWFKEGVGNTDKRDQVVCPLLTWLCAFGSLLCPRARCCFFFVFLKPHLTDAYGMQKCLDTCQSWVTILEKWTRRHLLRLLSGRPLERSGCKSRWHFTRLLSTETYAGLAGQAPQCFCSSGLCCGILRAQKAPRILSKSTYWEGHNAVEDTMQVDDFYIRVNLKHCLKWVWKRYKFSSR